MLNHLTEDSIRDDLQIILSIAENNLKDILHRKECLSINPGGFMLGDLNKIVERVKHLENLLFPPPGGKN